MLKLIAITVRREKSKMIKRNRKFKREIAFYAAIYDTLKNENKF